MLYVEIMFVAIVFFFFRFEFVGQKLAHICLPVHMCLKTINYSLFYLLLF